MTPEFFDSTRATGLSEPEAARRQQVEGYNELPQGT